ncbi:pentapeptide repeat-containing protein [Chitinophaga sp. Hz27]|uniref:pentapeptide repeat-containing protein n=1 Tax=Chitinophaga sp. Hz27 TaxID=3347169 RepID=UPI0035E279E5
MKTLKMLPIVLCLFAFQVQAQHTKPSNKYLDYSGQDLTNHNFTTMHRDALVGAKFVNSILNGCQFANMDLSDADFTGAVMGRSQKGPCSLAAAALNHTNFTNADMTDANLQYVTLTATNFTNAKLIGALFGLNMVIRSSSDGIRTKFVGTILDLNRFPIARWPTVYWSYTDLSNSRISGMTPAAFSFANKDITGAILRGNDFSRFNFQHCTMTGADLSGSNLSYANLTGAILYNTKFIGTHFNYANLSYVQCNNSNDNNRPDFTAAVMNNANMHGGNFSYAVMAGASLLNASADSCAFNYANFQSTDSVDVADFRSADISYSSFGNAAVNAVTFSNVLAIKTSFSNTTMQNTNFTDADMPAADFSSSNLQGVLFTGAVLQNAKFQSTTIQNVKGGAGVDFSCAQLGGADFTSADVQSANFIDAVMIPADSCCQQVDGYHCGTITINNDGYSATIFPKMTNKVTCPNGDYDKCKAAQWLVPGWKTNRCNQQHNTEIVWTRPTCNSNSQDTTGVIKFTDPNLKKAITDFLFKGKSPQPITRSLAAQVLALDLSDHNISNLGGLENFTSLRTLDLSQNKLTKADFFVKLPSVNALKLAHNQLSGTLDLSVDSLLAYLDASDNALTGINICPDAAINFLDASSNQLSVLNLTLQTYLNYLDLSNNRLTSVGNLSQMSFLTAIFLQNNSLKSIGNLKKIFNNGHSFLSYMDIGCNHDFDCTTLGLDSTPEERDFVQSSKCGVNTGVGCNRAK